MTAPLSNARIPMSHVDGIHHVSAISSDPQRNVDFYAGVLGLRCSHEPRPLFDVDSTAGRWRMRTVRFAIIHYAASWSSPPRSRADT
jgi:hypothetical protein